MVSQKDLNLRRAAEWRHLAARRCRRPTRLHVNLSSLVLVVAWLEWCELNYRQRQAASAIGPVAADNMVAAGRHRHADSERQCKSMVVRIYYHQQSNGLNLSH